MAQQRIGRYEILSEIAAGGQATVYRARDVTLGRVVALKILHPHLARDAQFRERFLREARMVASLTHPNVITVFEVGEEAGQLFMAMEFLPSTLHAMVGERGALRADQALDITRQVALALQTANENGIVHRDLKPQNILLTDQGIPKVTDFGIARATEFATMTATGAFIGTPQYASPEQSRGDPVDIRSDLYSLGIVLYEMLTGQTPLEGSTPQGVMRHHLENRDTPVDALAGLRLPSGVGAVLNRLLAKDAGARYQTPQELAQVLERALRGGLESPPSSQPDVPPPHTTPSQPQLRTSVVGKLTGLRPWSLASWFIAVSGLVAAGGGLLLVLNMSPAQAPTDEPQPATEQSPRAIPDLDGWSISTGETKTGTINMAGDTDTWMFEGVSGQLATIAMNGQGELDPMLDLYAPDGDLVATNDDGGDGNNALITDLPLGMTGTYTIVATEYSLGTGTYYLSLTIGVPPTPTAMPAEPHVEPLVPPPPPVAGSTESVIVSIPATQLWVDTGLTVSPGDQISITASGTAIFGDPQHANSAGPDGTQSFSNPTFLVTDPAIPAHSLVGNIADSSSLDGKGFFVGSSFQGVVPISDTTTFVEVHKDGLGGVDGLDGAISVTVSPDGSHLYAAGHGDDAVAVFSRDSATTTQSGKLFLSFNDACISVDRSSYNSYCWSGDNQGSFTTAIEITRGPSPTPAPTPTPTPTATFTPTPMLPIPTATPTATAAPPEPNTVTFFPDKSLEAAIREALDKPVGGITAEELATIETFNASNLGIADLSGIQYCVNLTYLDLGDNEITDISPLADLTNLIYLHLNDNEISDISPLVANSGLGEGDEVSFANNNLDLSNGSEDSENIANLEARGVGVSY